MDEPEATVQWSNEDPLILSERSESKDQRLPDSDSFA